MSRAKRLLWERDGKPFRLMGPARDLRDVLRRHGYTVYDIGNISHLEHEPPEDHTPYSETGYPGRAQYGVGYAIDIMPPKAGARSKVDGLPLPSLQQLGAQILADRNSGVTGIRWLKYMNWEPDRDNGGRCFKEAWRPTYKRTTSTDRGHIHMSGLTGHETSSVGAGYDPVTRIRGIREEDDEMKPTDQLTIADWARKTWSDDKGLQDGKITVGTALTGGYVHARRSGDGVAELLTLVKSLTKLVGGESADRVLAEIRTQHERTRQAVAGVAPAVLAALPDGDGPVSREDLEAALRSALGSLDGATPQS